MTVLLGEEREAIVRCCGRMYADRLVVGTSGNLSARRDDLVAVTPGGVDYDALTPELVGVHRLDGTRVEGALDPTSELPMHLTAYRLARGTGAVVHTHSTAATALSTLAPELPPIHYLVAMLGGAVRVAPYATYGTEELAATMAGAMEGRAAVILGNHGALTVGDTLAQAYTRAVYLEWLCEVYLRARAVGEPRLLPPEEIARVAGKLASYGPQPSADGG